ncbi:hypothetical protein ACC862_24025 [Rhizobium ruizarguesonis]
MKASTALQNRIMLALSKAGRLVFRNITAQGWAGKSFELKAGDRFTAPTKCRVVLDPYPINAGLCVGSGDIIGGESIVITPDMVGSTVLVFASWEVKSGTGRPTEHQKNFANRIRELGGIAEIVRSEEEAVSARLFKD